MTEPGAEARILNVNDDDASRDIVSRVLAYAGFDVIEAATGRDALQKLASGPDLVILDVQLPDVDGYEIARRIRANPATRLLPVLHLSAAVEPEARAAGLNAGADGYLAQPVEPDVLIATVRAILGARRTERELMRSLGQAGVILQNIADAVTAQDAAGNVIYANDAAQRLFGEQVLTRWRTLGTSAVTSAFDLFDEQGRPYAVDELPGRRVLRGEATASALVRWRRREPTAPVEDRWTLMQAQPVLDANGRPQLAINILRDVTEERRAVERLTLLTDASAILSATLDYSTTLLRVAALPVPRLGDWSLLHIAEGEQVRRIAFHADPRRQAAPDQLAGAPLRSSDAHAMPRPFHSGEAEILPADLSDRFLHERLGSSPLVQQLRQLGLRAGMSAPLMARGRVFGVLQVLCERPRLYTPADLQLLSELGHRAALAIDNARVLQEAQEAAELRRDLVAVVAHDLKNPLNAVAMAGSLLTRHAAPGAEGDRTRRQASIIARASDRMTRLIHDLLDISAIDAGRLELDRQRVMLGALVNEALDAIAPLAQEKSLQLARELAAEDEELVLVADRERLLQVLANLLGNAVKFTDNGGRVVTRARRGGRGIELEVQDSGCGIAPEHLPHVFDRYWRLRSQNRHGTGLGLSIVKGIVESHDGAVSVAATPGGGSTFTVTIPVGD